MSPKTCPQCGCLTEADGKSCSCGWRAISKKDAAATASDRQCHGYENHVRCQVEGWLSNNVRGGPWYCRRHMSVLNGMTESGERKPNAEHMQAIRDLIKRKTSMLEREPGQDAEEAA